MNKKQKITAIILTILGLLLITNQIINNFTFNI